MKNCIICDEYIENKYLFCKNCYNLNNYLHDILEEFTLDEIVELEKLILKFLEQDDCEELIEIKSLLYCCTEILNENFTSLDDELVELCENILYTYTDNFINNYIKSESLFTLINKIYDISKNEKNKNKFYDNDKNYILKKSLQNEREKEFFNFVKNNLNKKFTILPQINLQTIIDTNTYTRNDELYRNIDFCIFETETYMPLLAIELNGEQHYFNENNIKRDESVKQILSSCGLPILTYRNKNLIIDYKILEDIYKIIDF